MEFENANKKIIIWCVLIFLAGFILRIYTLTLKQDLHEDEALNILLSNYSETGWTKLPETNKEFTGKELKQMTYWNDGSLKDTLSDIKNLYIYTRDDVHTNLYYTLTRLVFTGTDNFDIKHTIMRGGILNLAIYTLSFFFMFKILALLFKNKQELIPFGLFTAFLNTASISNTCYLRPYILQESAFILVTYYFVKLLLKEKINIYKASLSIAFTLLTGYYSIIYMTILATVLFIKKIDNKLLFKMAGLSLLFTTIFYPLYFMGIISYRATESVERSLDFAKNLYYSFINFPLIYFKYLFSLSILVFLIYFLIKIMKNKLKSENDSNIISLVFWLNILWTAIILFIAPYKILRYIMPAFPLLSLVIPYILGYFKRTTTYIIIISVLFGLNYYFAVEFHKNQNIGKYVPIISKIDFLKNTQVDKFLFEENHNQPVLILKDQENQTMGEILKISEIMPYFNNNQKYIFINPNTKSEYKQFYMIIPKKPQEKFYTLAKPYYENYKRLKIQNCSTSYACIEFKQ